MEKMVALNFRAYALKREEITRGFITEENVEWVTKQLTLKTLTNEELNQMWIATNKYFNDRFEAVSADF